MPCATVKSTLFVIITLFSSSLFLVCVVAVVKEQVGYGNPPEHERYCVAVESSAKSTSKSSSEDKFECTNNPNNLLDQLEFDRKILPNVIRKIGKAAGAKYQTGLDVAPGERVSTGIPQRIDGTEVEQNAIKDVLKRMNEYYYNDILSLPEYDSVRQKCKNRNELCAFWASIGECESNRIFMLPNCAAACRLCLLQHTRIGIIKTHLVPVDKSCQSFE